jgi:protein arginine kinase activator
MKCQACDKPATNHVTEIVGGDPVEYHICDTHLQNLEAIERAPKARGQKRGSSHP